MKVVWMALIVVLLGIGAACHVFASSWPNRVGRTPEQMLTDVVRWQQLKWVKTSTGELAYECFTWVDLHSFVDSKEPDKIVARLRQAADFDEVVTALRGLSQERLGTALSSASSLARPTWRTMGFIDRTGAGQTEAGHLGDLIVAGAITDAFAAAIGAEVPKPRDNWRIPGPSSWPAE